MSDEFTFNGSSGALDHVKERALKFLTLAAISINRRAKELLSIPGTAFATGFGRRPKGTRITGAVRLYLDIVARKQTGRLRGSTVVTTQADPDQETTYEVDKASKE